MAPKSEKPIFNPPAFRRLEMNLGESDAIVEWIEVAMRHFGTEHKNGGNNHIQNLAKNYKVYVHPIDFNVISVKWAQFQILSVYQIFELFLKELPKEHPRIVKSKKDGEDRISYTLGAFNLKQQDIGVLECKILNYYHAIRNHLMHKITDEQKEDHLNQLNKILEIKSDRYNTLAAPNKIECLQFDDFILFSRVVKEFARRVCTLTVPTAEEFAVTLKKNRLLLKKLHGTLQNEKRLKSKLVSYIHTEFGYTCNGDLSSEILMHMGLLA